MGYLALVGPALEFVVKYKQYIVYIILALIVFGYIASRELQLKSLKVENQQLTYSTKNQQETIDKLKQGIYERDKELKVMSDALKVQNGKVLDLAKKGQELQNNINKLQIKYIKDREFFEGEIARLRGESFKNVTVINIPDCKKNFYDGSKEAQTLWDKAIKLNIQ